MKILIVEDNASLAGNLVDYCELLGHQVDYAGSGKQCLSLLEQDQFDVIVLDVMLPGIDGYETCRRLRAELLCPTPVIFLTAKVELAHKLEGFRAGGDDYLTKPFDIEELFCRIEALAIRGSRRDLGKLQFGELCLDTEQGCLTRQDRTIRLNKVQAKILQYLISQAPAVVSRRQLESEIWGEELPDSDVLKTHIYQLRRMIDKPFDHPCLETVHGRGYRLRGSEGL